MQGYEKTETDSFTYRVTSAKMYLNYKDTLDILSMQLEPRLRL